MKIKKRTLGDLLLKRVELSENKNAIGWIDDGDLRFIDFSQYKNTIEALALGLKKLGLKRKDRVGILGKTSKEWHMCDMATVCSGAAVVPVYHTYTADEVSYILNHSEASFLIVEDEEQLNKVIEAKEKINIKNIVVLEKIASELQEKASALWNLNTYEEVLTLGREEAQSNPDLFETIISRDP